MAGKIIADQIEHSTAGSVDTQYVVNGSAKAWAKVTYSGGVPSSADSINISSYNDDGTGTYDANFTNSMSSSDYSASGMAVKETRVITFNTFNSTFLELRVYDLVVGISSLSDSSSTFAIHGDLA